VSDINLAPAAKISQQIEMGEPIGRDGAIGRRNETEKGDRDNNETRG